MNRTDRKFFERYVKETNDGVKRVKYNKELSEKYKNDIFVAEFDNEWQNTLAYTLWYFKVIVVGKKIPGTFREAWTVWHEIGHIRKEEAHKDFGPEWDGIDSHSLPIARTDEVAADWEAVKRGFGEDLIRDLTESAVNNIIDGEISDNLDRIRRVRKFNKTGIWDAGISKPMSCKWAMVKVKSLSTLVNLTGAIGKHLVQAWIEHLA